MSNIVDIFKSLNCDWFCVIFMCEEVWRYVTGIHHWTNDLQCRGNSSPLYLRSVKKWTNSSTHAHHRTEARALHWQVLWS